MQGRTRAIRSTALVAVVAAALLASGCASGEASAPTATATELTGDPIKIGFINREAGTTQSLSQQSAGARAAVQYINEELGGVDGHPLEIEVCATDGTPATAQTCAQEMVSYDPSFVTTGTTYSMDVAYPVLEAAGIPVLGGTPTAGTDFAAPQARYWIGGTVSIVVSAAGYIIDYMPDVDNVGILVFNLPSGQAAIPLVQGPLEAAGKTVQVVQVPTTATDMLSPYTSLVDGGAEVVVALLLDQQCIALAQAAQSQNSDVTFLTQPGCYSEQIVQQAGGAMDGWIVPFYGPEPMSEGDEEAATFRDAMAKYEPDASVDGISMIGFNAIMTNYLNLLKNIPYEDLSYDTLLAQADEPGQTAFLGSDLSCGAVESFSSLCAMTSRWYEIQSDGNLKDMTDGEYVDALDFM